MEISGEEISSRVLGSDDRISLLPDPVICHILSFLETKLVVSTSILSKRWKFVWTGVTSLDFVEDPDDEEHVEDDDYDDGEHVEDDDSDEEEHVDDENMNFMQFVNRVLVKHDAKSLEKFQLIGGEGCQRKPDDVNRWISYATARNVKSLTVRVDSEEINLPGALFTSAALAFLDLYGKFELKLPPVVCLPKLEGLELCYLCYESGECFSKLISGCPVLHSLTIFRNRLDNMLALRVSSPSLKRLEVHHYPDFSNPDEILIVGSEGNVAIDAPNLEYLELRDQVSREISITRLTSAATVSIDLGLCVDCFDDGTARSISVFKALEALNNVRFLNLEGRVMKDLSSANIPLSVDFDRLTKLEIYCECGQWSYLSVLLGHLMKLEVLKIEMNTCFLNTNLVLVNRELCWKDPVEVPVCLSSTLQQISIPSFGCLEDEMEMIRYFLMHGAVLKLVDLRPEAGDVGHKSEMLQKISMFPRLSSACSIKFA